MILPPQDTPRLSNLFDPDEIMVSPGLNFREALIKASRHLNRAAINAYKVANPYSTTGPRPSGRLVAHQLDTAHALIEASIIRLTTLKNSANDA
ncbi:hypothetical protein [Pseudomonas ovata]|uniref:hypothetical protein n=1 Tax=Pseudomonas ovata TaxID=1839709 RepID=UPI000D687FD5|nr:hypothetical protein [Pseudomonas ovata]